MIGEFNIHGVYVPTLLIAAVIAGAANTVVATVLSRSGLYRWIWHRSLFDLASFVILFAAADALLSRGPTLLRPFL